MFSAGAVGTCGERVFVAFERFDGGVDILSSHEHTVDIKLETGVADGVLADVGEFHLNLLILARSRRQRSHETLYLQCLVGVVASVTVETEGACVLTGVLLVDDVFLKGCEIAANGEYGKPARRRVAQILGVDLYVAVLEVDGLSERSLEFVYRTVAFVAVAFKHHAGLFAYYINVFLHDTLAWESVLTLLIYADGECDGFCHV